MGSCEAVRESSCSLQAWPSFRVRAQRTNTMPPVTSSSLDFLSSISTLCGCCNQTLSNISLANNSSRIDQELQPPLIIRTSEFSISTKEIVILSLLLFLVVYSITMFINNWRRNYTDIYQPTFIYSTEEEKDESDHNLAQILPWEHEDVSRADSRMSKMSQVVKAKSVLERSRKDNSICCSSTHSTNPRRSFSASNLFSKSRSPNLFLLRNNPQFTLARMQQFCSFEEDFHYSSHMINTPRISVDDTDSSCSLAAPHRPYLKYHRRSNGPMISVDSEPSKEHSQQDISSHNSKTNLQICNSKEEGGSFSFSDLDPVQEDIEDQ